MPYFMIQHLQYLFSACVVLRPDIIHVRELEQVRDGISTSAFETLAPLPYNLRIYEDYLKQLSGSLRRWCDWRRWRAGTISSPSALHSQTSPSSALARTANTRTARRPRYRSPVDTPARHRPRMHARQSSWPGTVGCHPRCTSQDRRTVPHTATQTWLRGETAVLKKDRAYTPLHESRQYTHHSDMAHTGGHRSRPGSNRERTGRTCSIRVMARPFPGDTPYNLPAYRDRAHD